MKRIVILGCSGTGKSTLARKLGELLDLPVTYLDALFYKPNWASTETELFQERVREACTKEYWVSEGNFVKDTAAIRFPLADIIIWVDQPRWLRLMRAIRRCFRKNERNRADLASGCHDQVDRALISDIWNFDRIQRPVIETAIQQWAPDIPVIRLTGDTAVKSFLKECHPVAQAGSQDDM